MTGDILDAIDGTLRDCAVSGDAMRWSPDPEARERDADGGVSQLVTFDVSGFVEGLQQMCAAIARLGEVCAKAMRPMGLLAALCTGRHERPRARARCPKCNPAGNPGPLAIDGREYQRRVRNRRKRGR